MLQIKLWKKKTNYGAFPQKGSGPTAAPLKSRILMTSWQLSRLREIQRTLKVPYLIQMVKGHLMILFKKMLKSNPMLKMLGFRNISLVTVSRGRCLGKKGLLFGQKCFCICLALICKRLIIMLMGRIGFGLKVLLCFS